MPDLPPRHAGPLDSDERRSSAIGAEGRNRNRNRQSREGKKRKTKMEERIMLGENKKYGNRRM